MNRKIILIAHNLRSAHNIGSLIRTAEGLGIDEILLTGYSPYPELNIDERLPHMRQKISRLIQKTSLGAERTIDIKHASDIFVVISDLRKLKFNVCALEQSKKSIPLNDFNPSLKLALIVGNEVDGIDSDILDSVDNIIEIPMLGVKESFNVAQATAMALFHFRYSPV